MKNLTLAVAAFVVLIISSSTQAQTIVQTKGLDQNLDYRGLTRFGPWDDRNYKVTRQDVDLLSGEEHLLTDPIPAFFRIELRKQFPNLRRSGLAQYPRAAVPLFYKRYGGLIWDNKLVGKASKENIGQGEVVERIIVNNEIKLNDVLGADEVTVEINPADPSEVIAGANNNNSQEMYYSTDGGVNWTIQGTLPDTCCDPTVDWKSDGSYAYVAALSGALGVSFWRSADGGASWVDRVDLTSGGSDKEFIHVDRSPASAYQDNIYVTYHNSNTMQFARSIDDGETFSITELDTDPLGIGSDITTTSNGDIYYFYAAFGVPSIELIKSTDGGSTFAAASTVAITNAEYDWPIPAIETRNAWIYAATDSDRSGGTYDGNIYVAWTDTTAAESSVAADNHAVINVARSSDGGVTWSVSNPHPMDDTLTVDRFNQWIKVDETGNVHVVYYDTRHSVDRTGVDLYYNSSVDGGATWGTPQRISSATSANLTDGQEWGDYNGLSVFSTRTLPGWTDNRAGPPDNKNVYVADTENVLATPTFLLSGDNLEQQVCKPQSGPAINLTDINLDIVGTLGFTDPVTLSTTDLPTGFNNSFTVNPVTPTGISIAQLTVGPSATAGNHLFNIVASGGTGPDISSLTVDVDVFDATPGVPVLSSPVNGAATDLLITTLEWSTVPQTISYTVELDDDPAFGSIDFTVETSDTTTVTDPLASTTIYYWRVRASNSCGTSAESEVFAFITPVRVCSAPGVAIPDTMGSVSDDLVVATAGEVLDLKVQIDISHTWIGDIGVTLTHLETSTNVILLDRPGFDATKFGCSGDNITVTLDDAALSPAEDQCETDPALTGTHSPISPLSALNGENRSGTWRLTVTDAVGGDSGTLDTWCLEFGSVTLEELMFEDGFEN
ncbi:MAG: proprotein convertase P-domain-containing protein [Xanthomonadales bacterium]|nr:proprotein convertase P-domain-containing protein [Xanthomonadales bacterium]